MKPIPQLNYKPQLDTIRAIAVIGVLIHHYIGGFLSFGGNGVHLFFVLSGFLITDILLNAKNDHQKSKFTIIRNFIIRRAFRIFPIYYLIILFFLITGDPYIREKFLWFISYSSNILFFKSQSLENSNWAHTWSLAVEEQFYLIWPWLMIFLPRRKEIWAILTIIGIAYFFRIIFYINHTFSATLLITNIDSLGMGSLFAWLNVYKKNLFLKFKAFFSTQAIFTILIFSIADFYYFQLPLVFPILFSVLSIMIIVRASFGFSAKIFWENRFLIYIGKISYGVYLFHKFVPFYYKLIISKLNLTIYNNRVIEFTICVIITILVAGISFKFVEKPILKQKKYFEY